MLLSNIYDYKNDNNPSLEVCAFHRRFPTVRTLLASELGLQTVFADRTEIRAKVHSEMRPTSIKLKMSCISSVRRSLAMRPLKCECYSDERCPTAELLPKTRILIMKSWNYIREEAGALQRWPAGNMQTQPMYPRVRRNERERERATKKRAHTSFIAFYTYFGNDDDNVVVAAAVWLLWLLLYIKHTFCQQRSGQTSGNGNGKRYEIRLCSTKTVGRYVACRHAFAKLCVVSTWFFFLLSVLLSLRRLLLPLPVSRVLVCECVIEDVNVYVLSNE